MDFDLFDEFGNFKGELISDKESEQSESLQDQDEPYYEYEEQDIGDEIILHEDKKYYPDLEETYPGAEVLIQDEDTENINTPIIPRKAKKYENFEKQSDIPNLNYSIDYLTQLMDIPERIYCVCFLGSLHSGKTSMIDYLVEETYPDFYSSPDKQPRFTDTREDERLREISIKTKPISLALEYQHKHYLFHIIDTPGHSNFIDEAMSGLRLADGAFLVVDVIEGVLKTTEIYIQQCITQQVPMVLIINKIDRLVLELNITPTEAYYKIKHTLDEVNNVLSQIDSMYPLFDVKSNNVIFSSGKFGVFFNLESIAKQYIEENNFCADLDSFKMRLWGNWYFHNSTFTSTLPPNKPVNQRTFVEFVLEPLYKIIGYSISQERIILEPFLASIGVILDNEQYSLNQRDMVKVVCSTFYGKAFCLRQAAINLFPQKFSDKTIKDNYKDEINDEVNQITKQLKTGPLYVHITKLYNDEEFEKFYALGRVLSGTLKVNEKVKILGENYSSLSQDDYSIQKVQNIYLYNSQFKIQINQAQAGNLVLIKGVDQIINGCSTIVQSDSSLFPLKSLYFPTQSIVKLAIEPNVPQDLPMMLDALRKCNKSYPHLQCIVEESGEHVIMAPGELYLDSVIHDIRKLYTDIDLKLSDPFISFCETVTETSSFKTFSDTINGENRIAIIAEPLEQKVATDIERGFIPKQKMQQHFQIKYDWDILAANNIWAFGPDQQGPNILINDILPGEGNPELLLQAKGSIIHGFQWACRSGPLCEEPIRNTKYRIIESSISPQPIYRAPGQVIPAARKVCYSSFLIASPKLMEPFYEIEIQCTQECIQPIYSVLSKRRGHVTSEEPKPGSPLYIVKGSIPVIDSFGFETDLRVCTSGMAFCSLIFEGWSIVPGDPLDRSIELKILEPNPVPVLAREFMVKTRRRKGLTDDISVVKFFENEELLDLARNDQDLKQYFS